MVRKVLDELVGRLLFSDDDEVVDVAEDGKLMAYTHIDLSSVVEDAVETVWLPDAVAKVLAQCADHKGPC